LHARSRRIEPEVHRAWKKTFQTKDISELSSVYSRVASVDCRDFWITLKAAERREAAFEDFRARRHTCTRRDGISFTEEHQQASWNAELNRFRVLPRALVFSTIHQDPPNDRRDEPIATRLQLETFQTRVDRPIKSHADAKKPW